MPGDVCSHSLGIECGIHNIFECTAFPRKEYNWKLRGAWYDPEKQGEVGTLDVHGCDNVLTIDIPSSKLANGNVANSSQVRIEKFTGELPRVRVWEQPRTVRGRGTTGR